MAKKRRKKDEHYKGWECQPWYDRQRRLKRTCSCGRLAVGLTQYDSPVCSFHNHDVTKAVKPLPPIELCPGPHVEKSK